MNYSTYPTLKKLQLPWNATLVSGTEPEPFNGMCCFAILSFLSIVEGLYIGGFLSAHLS